MTSQNAASRRRERRLHESPRNLRHNRRMNIDGLSQKQLIQEREHLRPRRFWIDLKLTAKNLAQIRNAARRLDQDRGVFCGSRSRGAGAQWKTSEGGGCARLYAQRELGLEDQRSRCNCAGRSEPLAPPGLPSQTGRQHSHRVRSPQPHTLHRTEPALLSPP